MDYSHHHHSINYGSILTLKHEATSHHLHSHPANYTHPGSSGQQQITCYNGSNSDNNFRIVPGLGLPSLVGPIANGSIVRLQHINTGAFLHSHVAKSPVTGQQEVTGFTGGDQNDNWRLELEGGYFKQKSPFRLVHVATNRALHSHNAPYQTAPGNIQQEVTGFEGRDQNDFWTAHVVENGPQAQIAFGSMVAFKHVATNCHLHSHPIKYTHPGSSGQQQITAFGGFDQNDKWVIQPAPGTQSFGFVQNGSVVTLKHVATGVNLHSHVAKSPVTGQQEVTGFGGNDQNDFWRVEVSTNSVSPGTELRLVHVATNFALHSHNAPFEVAPGNIQQEVTCFEGRDQNDLWVIFNL